MAEKRLHLARTRSEGVVDRRAVVLWTVAAILLSGAAVWAQVIGANGDLAVILRVGDESGTRSFIESELGPVPLTEGLGHDGQYSYLIARDPFGLDGLPDLADDGPYRYRRALYGWVAGVLGWMPPEAALVGLALVAVTGFAAAVGAGAALPTLIGTRPWVVFGVVANVGLILSVQLATSDALAIALALLGVVLVLRGRTAWAVIALGAAALTKDVYVLFAFGMGGWMFFEGRRREGAVLAAVPGVALAAWVLWLQLTVGPALSSKGNLSAPFVGIAESFSLWDTTGDLALALLAAIGLLGSVAVVIGLRQPLLSWLALPWIAVAVFSSAVVWGDGNNAVRAFAPLWLFAWLGIGWWLEIRDAAAVGT